MIPNFFLLVVALIIFFVRAVRRRNFRKSTLIKANNIGVLSLHIQILFTHLLFEKKV